MNDNVLPFLCTWQLAEAQRKLSVVLLHTHSSTLFQTTTDAWLPLKIIVEQEATSATGNDAPFSPRGCQYLGHKNPMAYTHRKVNYMPVLFHFNDTDGIYTENKIRRKTGEGIFKC